MRTLLTKATQIYRSEGVRPLLRRGRRYAFDRWIRPWIPKRICVYNGVAVRDRLPFDTPVVRPNYEAEIIARLREYVIPGDTVVVVGGGRGASAVVAGRHATKSGSVIAYEGGKRRAHRLTETTRLNHVEKQVETQHVIVGSATNVWGAYDDATVVRPEELPECDILEMDCESAEVEILANLQVRPRTIIVETHGAADPTDNKVAHQLSERGYSVIDVGLENREYGCFVLTAIRDD